MRATLLAGLPSGLGLEASCSGRALCSAFRAHATLARSGRSRRRTLSVRAEPASAEAAADPAAAAELVTAAAEQQQQALQDVRRQKPDPYQMAGQRLRSLLTGVGDGEEEMLNNMIEESPPLQKLGLCLAASGGITLATALLCWLCGLDPLGGASLSVASLQAAAVGGAAAAPLVMLKAALWSDEARRELPFLEDVHKSQVEAFKPVISNLSTPQTLVLLASEVVPSLLILLPATAGGVAKGLELVSQLAGVQLPELLPTILSLMIAAAVAGVWKEAETSVTVEEWEVVHDALENADRYYRVMAMDRDSTPADAQRAAAAFKAVALTWIARNRVAMRFAGSLAALEVIYLGVLWQQTGDLAAPLVASLGASAVDFAFIRRLADPVKPPSSTSSS